MEDEPADRVRRLIEAEAPLEDLPVTRHGFAGHHRDYLVDAEVPAARPDASGSVIVEHRRYRFTHCVLAETRTAVPAEVWRRSWDDVLTDAAAWERAGEPPGFLWAVGWADGYPGLRLVADSADARHWSAALARPMHEARLATNTYVLRLVFCDLVVTRTPVGPG